MAIRKDRGRFVCEFQQGGKRVFKRLPAGVTKAQAQEWETKQRRALFDRDELGHQEDLTLAGAIGLWLLDNRRKNQRKAASEARQWEPYTKGRLLREAPEIASQAAQDWRRLRPAENGRPPSLSTIDRRLALLKSVCKYAWKQNLIGENLSGRITMFNPPNEREVYLSRGQVVTLAKSAPTSESRAAIMLLAYTGLRVSELLCQPAVERRSATLSVSRTTAKNRKSRLVPVPTVARPYLQALPLGLSYWQLRKQFIAACKGAGIKGVRIHDLRHTYASWLANKGEDLYTIATLLGDELQSAKRYTHLIHDRLKQAVEGLR